MNPTRAPHFLRFARALALVSTTSLVPIASTSIVACSSSNGTVDPPAPGVSAMPDAPYDGVVTEVSIDGGPDTTPMGIAPMPDADAGESEVADGDASDSDGPIPPGGPLAPPEMPRELCA